MFFLFLLYFQNSVIAKSCGGLTTITECNCGDKIVESYVLKRDLNCTGDIALTIASDDIEVTGLKPDGTAPTIQRTVRPTHKDVYGIHMSKTDRVVLSHIVVRGFTRGVHVSEGNNNTIQNMKLIDNGYFDTVERKNVGYGMDLTRGSAKNKILDNEIRDNWDEGMHLGTGPKDNAPPDLGKGNLIKNNLFVNNGVENLYLLWTNNTRIIGNEFYGGKSNSIHIENSSKNIIKGNIIADKPVALRGNALNNKLKFNSFAKTSLFFGRSDGYEPMNNILIGGEFESESDCQTAKRRIDEYGLGNRYRRLPCQ